MNIDKDILKALMLFAPKDDIRYYLNGVNVQVKDGKLRLTACGSKNRAGGEAPKDGKHAAPGHKTFVNRRGALHARRWEIP